jgi:DNA invertase Pin-like site-specific DNA recombinase
MLNRCNEGRAVAMSKGVKMGRPKVLGTQMEHSVEKYKAHEMSVGKICEATGVAKATFCRRLKELGLTSKVVV